MADDTMRITIRSRLRSYMFNRVQYMRGKVYVLARPLAEQLLATGEFKVAILPPPDPRAKQRTKAAALINTLAGLPGDALDRLMRLANTEAQASADAGAESGPEPEPKPKTKAKPKLKAKKPKGVITSDKVAPEPAKQSTKAAAEGEKPKPTAAAKRKGKGRRPSQAEPETLADLD